MQNTQHQNIVGFIWNIANKLFGPYQPPQYRIRERRLFIVVDGTADVAHTFGS